MSTAMASETERSELGSAWEPGDGVVCPFCGSVSAVAKSGRCPQCTLVDNPATRAATKTRNGPWYLLQDANTPARGMTFETLVSLVQRGVVTPESVVRGPGTHQLWRWAGKVKGLSREMGFCYTCGESVGTTAETCPHCNRSQTVVAEGERASEIRAAIESVAAVTPVATPAPVADGAARLSEVRGGEAAVPPRPQAGERFVPREPDFPEDVVRPAMEAEPVRPERARRAPREDLLTPTEVAKAFSINFDFQQTQPTTQAEGLVRRPVVGPRTVKLGAMVAMVLASAGVFYAKVLPPVIAGGELAATWVETRVHRASGHTVAVPAVPTEIAAAMPARSNPVAVASNEGGGEPAAALAGGTEPAMAASPADDVRRLWATALEAESRRDFVAAVRAYERIQSLPSSAWPADLGMRLKLAKYELVAGTY